MPPTVDVVIPVHDHYELTARCLEHLAAQTAEHTVIVVDDGSSDGTPARLRDAWPAVRVLDTGENAGYVKAVNRGVAAGEGEIVVLLNNDVELDSRCIELLRAPFEDDPQVGSVAALMLRPGGELIDSFGITADATLAGFARMQGLPRAAAANGGWVLAGPEGTAGAYRRAAWEQAGGFDERITAYMEVLDLALRVRADGWRAAQAAAAFGIHLGSRSYGRLSSAQRSLSGFSRGYLLRRYGVLRGRAAARTLFTEAGVVAVDAVTNRDLQALRGRTRGWRAAGGLARLPSPPPEAIDHSIGLARSLALRRAAALGGG